jgi:hypothetical protein
MRATHDPRALRTVLDIHSTTHNTHQSSLIQQRSLSNSNFKRMFFFTAGAAGGRRHRPNISHTGVCSGLFFSFAECRLGSLPAPCVFSHPPKIMRHSSPRLIMASQARMSKAFVLIAASFSLSSRVNCSTLDLSWTSLPSCGMSATLFC